MTGQHIYYIGKMMAASARIEVMKARNLECQRCDLPVEYHESHFAEEANYIETLAEQASRLE